MSLELRLDADSLRPLVQLVVGEVLAALDAERDRVAWTESEAAGLLGVKDHVLRDLRLTGQVSASRSVGGRILYQRSDLVAYLAERRVEADGSGQAWRRERRG
jgi:hypothetical protein